MTSEEILLTGGCMCGNIKYTSTTLPTHLTNCYCQTCRRLSGSPFITFSDLPVSSLTWKTGSSSLKYMSYSDIAVRAHCPECGSPIYMQYKCEPEVIGITAGTIDEGSIKGTLPKIGSHIFVEGCAGTGGTGGGEEKVKEERIGGWYELSRDDVPRYQKYPTSFQKKLDTWKKGMEAGSS